MRHASPLVPGILLAAALAACAPMPAPSRLQPLANSVAVSAHGQATEPDVVWLADTDASLEEADHAELLQQLRRALAQLQSAQPSHRWVLRGAITHAEPVHPGLNMALTVLLLGPLESGGGAVQLQALDPATGRVVVSLNRAYRAPLSEWQLRFERLGPVRWALGQAVADFAALLQAGAAPAQ